MAAADYALLTAAAAYSLTLLLLNVCRYSKAVQAATHLGRADKVGSSKSIQNAQGASQGNNELHYMSLLIEEELMWVMGRSIQQLFPGAFEG